MKWEYIYIKFRWDDGTYPEDMHYRLNILGKDGFELVTVYDGIAYFKRPLRPKSENELLYEIDKGRASLV